MGILLGNCGDEACQSMIRGLYVVGATSCQGYKVLELRPDELSAGGPQKPHVEV